MALRILAGSRSPHHDRAEHSPVGFSSVEQCSDSVVFEVSKAKTDPLDSLDEVVERFGWCVGDASKVKVADLVEPLLQCSSELSDLGWHGFLQAMSL